MAVTIVATVGSASANSYVTQAEADTHLEGRLNVTAWTGATSDEKNRALVAAARELQVLNWVAGRVDSTQALAWPRQYAENPDAPSIVNLTDLSDRYYATTEIPDRVKRAQIEWALEFLKAGTTDLHSADPNAGKIRERVDVLETEWEPYAKPEGLARFPLILNEIGPLLATTAGQLEIART